MTIEIKNQQKQIPIPESQMARMRRIVQKILRHEDVSRASVSIVFVTDSRIKSLNKRFLKRNHPTDVLAFDFSGGAVPAAATPAAPKDNRFKKIEGEIVVSADTACKNARIFKTSIRHELILYVIHGILHLLGYDDHRSADIKQMRRKEEELMRLAKVITDYGNP